MKDLNDFGYFVQVVRHGGFSAAARATGLQKSLLSRRIRLLEERLHAQLVQRTSRHFSVTEAGQRVYEHSLAMLSEAEAAEQSVAPFQSEHRGTIHLNCPVALLHYQFGDILARFMKAYPAIILHLDTTNRAVDVIKEELDLAIRVRFPPLPPSDLMMRTFDTSTHCLVAAPDLVPHPLTSPADLKNFPSLDFHTLPGTHTWTLENQDGQTATVFHEPRLVTDDMTTLRTIALTGAGIVELPTIMVWQDIEAGRLVPVLPDWHPKAGIVHAVFPSRRGLMPAVRTLLDFLAHECRIQRKRASAAFRTPPNLQHSPPSS